MAGPGGKSKGPARETLRLDKWLWHARFWKSRSYAMADIASGSVRVNGQRVTKPACPVGHGDTLTFMQGDRVRVIRVLQTGTRRGPAEEALTLYLDLDAPVTAAAPTPLE